MKGGRHSEEQIIAILKQGEAGVTTAELCRLHGIREQTYYRRKAKYGGMESCDAKRQKQLGRRESKAEARGDRTGAEGRALKQLEAPAGLRSAVSHVEGHHGDGGKMRNLEVETAVQNADCGWKSAFVG